MYRQSEKNLLSSNISSTCPHNMVNFGLLVAEIYWQVCGTPVTFNGFCVLTSLLQRRRSSEANQTLHDVWPSHGLVRYICILGALPPDGILPGAVFTLRPSLAFSYSGSVTARHYSSKLCGVVQGMELWNFRRGRQLCSASAGRPSRWASAHILVDYIKLQWTRSLRSVEFKEI